MARISLILIKGTQGYDISDLVIQLKWSGRKGSSSRTLEATLLDDDGHDNARAGVNVEEGHQCIFSYDGAELFRGIIMKQGQTQKKQLTFKAYDNGIYLANNKDTFVYTNKTATDIFKDICTRFGLPYSEAAQTTYKIPELAKPKTTAFDAIADALSQEYKATGIRHYIDSQKGSLRLLTRRENVMQWVLEVGQNIVSYSSDISIEKVKTRIKLLSDEGTVLAEKKDTALEKKIGVMQDIDEPDETLNTAQLEELATSMLKENSTPDRNLKLTTLGLPEVISGLGVFVVIPALNINKTYYVDQDTHTFKDNYHSMSLVLNQANDFEYESNSSSSSSSSSSSDSGSSIVGSTVNFKGGSQYFTSGSTSPTGGTRKAGPAKVTNYAKGAKHPYHVVGGAYNELDGDSNVYGWVDASQIS